MGGKGLACGAIAATVALESGPALADVVTLRSGDRIEGKVVAANASRGVRVLASNRQAQPPRRRADTVLLLRDTVPWWPSA
jgi:hypothetical protein